MFVSGFCQSHFDIYLLKCSILSLFPFFLCKIRVRAASAGEMHFKPSLLQCFYSLSMNTMRALSIGLAEVKRRWNYNRATKEAREKRVGSLVSMEDDDDDGQSWCFFLSSSFLFCYLPQKNKTLALHRIASHRNAYKCSLSFHFTVLLIDITAFSSIADWVKKCWAFHFQQMSHGHNIFLLFVIVDK